MISWWWLLIEAGVIGAMVFARWVKAVRLTDEQLKTMMGLYQAKADRYEELSRHWVTNKTSHENFEHCTAQLRVAQSQVAKLQKALSRRDGRQGGELSLVKGGE